MTVGPDRSLWFTELTGDKVGRFALTPRPRRRTGEAPAPAQR
jgi:hypothetical protein